MPDLEFGDDEDLQQYGGIGRSFWTPGHTAGSQSVLLPNGTVFNSGSQTKSNIFNPSTKTWTVDVATTNFGSTRTYGTSVLLPLSPVDLYKPRVIIMGGTPRTSDAVRV